MEVASNSASSNLKTDDLSRDYHEMKARGVKFHGEPRQESYGKVVVFED